MKAGTSYCNDPEKDAFSAGKHVVETAMESCGMDQAHLVISFCSPRIDPDEFLRGLAEPLDETAIIIGGPSIGVIGNDELSYGEGAVGAAVFQFSSHSPHAATVSELEVDPLAAGRALAKELSPALRDHLLLLFYSSVKVPPSDTSPWILNSSAPILEGIAEESSSHTPVAGAGLLANLDFSASPVFCNRQVREQSAAAVAIPPEVRHYSRIMHGCTPMDGIYRKITKMKDSVLYELDGEPIVKVIDNLYGNSEWQNQRPVINLLTLGVNLGDRYAEPHESQFVNRLITGVIPDGTGVNIFETDLKEGDEILFMIRDTGNMIVSARKNTTELMNQIAADNQKPLVALYIDCGGRTAAISNTLVEEAAEVQAVLNASGTPLLGMYSGVEIAPFKGQNRGLDWTGVLLVLTEDV